MIDKVASNPDVIHHSSAPPLAASSTRPMVLYQSLILGLVLIAVWLRLWRLDVVPPGLWFDEAYNAMDALWMRETGAWPVFLQGNNGREVIFHYLLALSIDVFGETAYAVRLVSALLGILTIPLMYRCSAILFRGERNARWVALVSAAGLTTSFWFLTMNRAGYRANLLPLFVLLVSCFFWRGWQTGKIHYYLMAGVGLGLSQYTYLSARLLPLVFLLFVSTQTFLNWKNRHAKLKIAWFGLLVMAGISALIAGPLLLFFINNPNAFWGRVGDVAIKIDGSGESLKMLGNHLWQAVRVFVDGEDPNWRHHLLGRPAFDWVNTLGFVVGFFLAVKHYRRPVNQFLLLSLFVMWLPAPLSEPALHTLRLAGILPAYYIFVAIGLIGIVSWGGFRLFRELSDWQVGFTALTIILVLSGGLTFYDYFYRWGKEMEVYESYDGHVADLAHYLTTSTSSSEVNLVIPFYLYTHASMRYFLHNDFEEEVLLPDDALSSLDQHTPVSLIIPEYPPDDGNPPAFVWLVKDGAGSGTAYVSTVQRDISLARLTPESVDLIKGSRDTVIGQQYSITTQDVLPLFFQKMPGKKIAVEWADNLLLTGYEFVPGAIEAGDASNLYLAWEILGHTGLKEKMFLQVLDSRGNPVGQQEIEPISRKMYRWRDDGMILEQHPLNIDAGLSVGLYFVRLGFFDPKTGERLPTYGANKQPLGNEMIVGPLYVSANGVDPISPQYPLQAMLGDELELLGYSIYPAEIPDSTIVELYWKTHTPVDTDYTVFVQLLDQQNQLIAQADAQPLSNIYPTSRWQQGDIISERFVLPVSKNELLGENRLVTGMYNLDTGIRLPVYGENGDLLSDGLVPLVRND